MVYFKIRASEYKHLLRLYKRIRKELNVDKLDATKTYINPKDGKKFFKGLKADMGAGAGMAWLDIGPVEYKAVKEGYILVEDSI